MICCRVSRDVAFHPGKAACAEVRAACSSDGVDCGTRVTRAFVAGSCRSIHCVVVEAWKVLSRKLGVSVGLCAECGV